MFSSKKKKRVFFIIFILFISIYSSVIIYNLLKPLPEGVSIEGSTHQVNDVDFLQDLTYQDDKGNTIVEQEIMTTMIQEIELAENFIIVDMFLFNSDSNHDQKYPKITEAFTKLLIEKKQNNPHIKIIFISDKVNTVYGAYTSPEFTEMEKNDIEVVETELDSLRDSNPLYTGLWRMFIQWFGTSTNGNLPNMLAKNAPDVSTRSYLELLNVKANHRKLLITEQSAIISSGNIHNASGFHSNTAFLVKGNVINDLLKSEKSISEFSEPITFPSEIEEEEDTGPIKIQLLTEGKIATHAINSINKTDKGDTIWIGMLYIADREIILELKDAAVRGVTINIILDPNQNSFGNKKAGLPNVPVAAELIKSSDNIHIRWYNTGQEQYHTKMMLIEGKKENTIISGSANFTRRNLRDLNLETDLKIVSQEETEVMVETKTYFEKLWNNENGKFTNSYDTQDELPIFRYMLYRLQRIFWFTTY